MFGKKLGFARRLGHKSSNQDCAFRTEKKTHSSQTTTISKHALSKQRACEHSGKTEKNRHYGKTRRVI